MKIDGFDELSDKDKFIFIFVTALTIGLIIGISAGYVEFYNAGKFCCESLKQCLNTTMWKNFLEGPTYGNYSTLFNNFTFVRPVK